MATDSIPFIPKLNKDGKVARGEAMRWLNEIAVPHQGDDCLIWPFYRMASGHAKISSRKRSGMAHVYIASEVHGEKPSNAHEVCHACGNGHLGCVNPRHLYWGTRADNMADRKEHGVLTPPPVLRGGDNPRSVLSEKDIPVIRKMLADGLLAKEIAPLYGVGKNAIYGIKYGTSWAWVP